MGLALLLVVAVTATCVVWASSPSDDQCFSGLGEQRSGGISLQAMLDGSTTFALRLFGRLAQEASEAEANALFSPFSVWSALMLAYVGARGSTETELGAVLGMANASKADAARTYKVVKYWYLLRETQQRDNFTLQLVNSLFVDRAVPLRPCILKYFGSEIEKVDFVRAPETARRAMNSWVERHTHHLIRELFPPGSVDGSAALALVNAAYFKGKWAGVFPRNATRKALFHVTRDRRISVDMMHRSGNFYCGTSEALGCQALELPFAGEEISLLVLLPEEGKSAAELARRMTTERLHELRQLMWLHEVDVALPRFRLEHSLNLASAIGELGVQSLFQMSRADLSGFSEQLRLAVGPVRHKASLHVHEEGSEAAAATGMIAWRSARPAFPDTFTADRPFVVLLHDNLSNAVLFLGAVNRPSSDGNDV